jgi:hypothetical protein
VIIFPTVLFPRVTMWVAKPRPFTVAEFKSMRWDWKLYFGFVFLMLVFSVAAFLYSLYCVMF